MDTIITDPNDPIFNYLLTSYTDSAWQLLTLPHYINPHEQDTFDQFLNGTPHTDTWVTNVVTPAITAEKDLGRVHIIERTTDNNGKLALSDYLRYTLHRYEAAKAAGETIRIAWTEPGSWPRNIGEAGNDFWLFDEDTGHGTLVKRQHHADGTFHQALVTNNATHLRRAAKIKRAALIASKPFHP